MEIDTLNIKTLNIRDKRVANTSLFPYDLPHLIKKLKESPGWNNGELAASILLKSPDKQIVLTVLHDDTKIKSFQPGDSITFQLIEGKMKFHSQEKTIILESGQIMTLYNKIKFCLTTHAEESAFLLTINTGSSEPDGN